MRPVRKMRQSYIIQYERWERALFLRVAVLRGWAPAYGEVVMLCSVGLQLLQEVGARCAVVASVLRSSVVVFLDSVRGGLKGQCHEIFCFRLFSWIISPKPKITLWSFRKFSKFWGDICKWKCTTGINDTGGKFATDVNDTGSTVPLNKDKDSCQT